MNLKRILVYRFGTRFEGLQVWSFNLKLSKPGNLSDRKFWLRKLKRKFHFHQYDSYYMSYITHLLDVKENQIFNFIYLNLGWISRDYPFSRIQVADSFLWHSLMWFFISFHMAHINTRVKGLLGVSKMGAEIVKMKVIRFFLTSLGHSRVENQVVWSIWIITCRWLARFDHSLERWR